MSVSSTPQPKKKRRAWSELLKDVDVKLIPEDLDLEAVLSAASEADLFVQNGEFAQQAIVQVSLEGKGEYLIHSVMASIKVNTEKPLTDVDKVKKFLLAPSTLDPHSFLNVVNALFKKPIPALKYFPDLLFSSPYTSTSPTTSNPATSSQATSSSPATTSAATSSATVKKVQLVLNETMKELHYKEACGIPLLGVFVAHLAKTLTDTTSFEILADMEFSVVTHKLKSGVKPASDAAMVVALVYAVKPVLLYEYKPVVDPRVDRIERKALIEVLLQGFYCLYQHNVTTVIHCLTDLSQWYYFKLEKEKPSNMKIVWFQSIHEEELNLHTHFSFLEPVVTNELLPMHTLYSSLEHTCM